jgi:hypothetical protein
MKISTLKKICISVMLIGIFGVPLTALYAQIGDYTVLAPLPNTTIDPNCTGTNCKASFTSYLPGVFKFSIAVAAILAFAVISYGGFLQMTSDSVMKTDEGKKYVWGAIQGLLLVIGAYAILYTINPQFLSFNLSLETPQLTNNNPSVPPGSVPSGPVSGMSETELRTYLASKNISVNAGPCTGSQTTGCTNLANITQSTLTRLEALNEECGRCGIRITGGSEGGHSIGSAHPAGKAVDLAPNNTLNQVITGGGQIQACRAYSRNGVNFVYEPRGSQCGGPNSVASSNDHWHTVFP